VNDITRQMVEGLGGEENLTPGVIGLLASVRASLTVILLAEADIARAGSLTTAEGELLAAVKLIPRYANNLRQVLKLLREFLSNSRQPGSSLNDILAEYRNKSRTEG
jgi:hypothetical protein